MDWSVLPGRVPIRGSVVRGLEALQVVVAGEVLRLLPLHVMRMLRASHAAFPLVRSKDALHDAHLKQALVEE